MRSVADRVRAGVEWASYGGAVLLLAWTLLDALRPPDRPERPAVGALDSARLAEWTRGGVPQRLHVRIDSFPSPLERDWAAALARGGSTLTWSGSSLVPIAASVEPIVVPGGAERVRVAAPAGATVAIGDAAGVIDSSRAARGGLVLTSRTLVGPVEAVVGAGRATVERGASVEPRPLLVIARAGWEAKFVISALEEQGWDVAARLLVAPGTYVEQGRIGVIDTARLSAVVALDASAADVGAAVVRYARAGGGVILAGDAAGASAFRAIAPGIGGDYLAARPASIPDSAPRSVLGLHPVVLRARDAIVLERRTAVNAVAARRVGLGRVVQIGYDDTWRWRLGGGEDAPREHAAWWSAMVSAVAHAPRAEAPPAASRALDGAPFARLVATLGPSSDEPSVSSTDPARTRWWIMPVIAALLLASWASRRLRGAP
jgi:hypothetical protein